MRKKPNNKKKPRPSKQEKQMSALMKRIEKKEREIEKRQREIEQKEKDELKYKGNGEDTWMGPLNNGSIDRGKHFYSK